MDTRNKPTRKKLPTSEYTISIIYLAGSAKIFTILFKRFRPNTVSSQLIFTDTFSGSKHVPSREREIKQGNELLKSSPLNRKHKPEASSRLAETGMSTDTRKRFALLSIFRVKPSQMTRNWSFTCPL